MGNKRIIFICLLSLFCTISTSGKGKKQTGPVQDDRVYWSALLYRISEPVLSNMSRGELKKNMTVELSPTWLKGRNPDLVYSEAFGRLMAGLAPWLGLPDDETEEGKMRRRLREWALKSYANAVDPASPDALNWEGEGQVLCDASYIATSFIRAPQALWEPLDSITKQRYIDAFHRLKKVRPAYNNWLLFRTLIEAFLYSVGEEYDAFVMEVGLQKINEWYRGDGWYSDGPEISFDYYNSYVIHPMLVEILDLIREAPIHKPLGFDLAYRRMQRYNIILERLISPEGTFPAVGRSMTYRFGAFQSLALSAWKYELPEPLTDGQVRSAMTAVLKRMFGAEGNFDKKGYLRLGFVGHQPNLADYYTDNGSLYITSLGFLPLGLPADHPFWISPAEEWTSVKAWSGKTFPKDYHESIMK